jgi:hypothetical protein
MARPRTRGADVGRPLEAALAEPGTEAPPEAKSANGGPGEPPKGTLALPTSKTGGTRALETSTILLHGEAGIGKSTLASQFPDFLFIDTAGELVGLNVYKLPVSSWLEFREAGALILADQKGDKRFKGVAVDTASAVANYVREAANASLGISHESQADWGQGWDKVRTEFSPRMATLSAIPDFGVLWIAHSKTVEIKSRSAAYDRHVPDLPGVVQKELIRNADLILFLDYNEEDERTIYTKPNPYHEAKERGEVAMLPEQVAWPLGTNGYQALKGAWGEA